jgi:hypothetical protein
VLDDQPSRCTSASHTPAPPHHAHRFREGRGFTRREGRGRREQAFKNYDEAGNQRRIQCLKYLVLANMLMESQVDPFDAQEAKPYKVRKRVQCRGTAPMGKG